MKQLAAVLGLLLISLTVFATENMQEARGRCTISISGSGGATFREMELTTNNICYQTATNMVKEANNRKLPVGVAVKNFKTDLTVNFEVIE